jgi:predicted exporter
MAAVELEHDARRRVVVELEHAEHQQPQAFFVFWKNLLVPVGNTNRD